MVKAMHWTLQVEREDRRSGQLPTSFHLGTARNRISVGRAEECDFLLEGRDIAPVHCQVIVKGGELLLVKPEKLLPLALDGKQVSTQQVLSAGEHTIELSGVSLRVSVRAISAPEAKPTEVGVRLESKPMPMRGGSDVDTQAPTIAEPGVLKGAGGLSQRGRAALELLRIRYSDEDMNLKDDPRCWSFFEAQIAHAYELGFSSPEMAADYVECVMWAGIEIQKLATDSALRSTLVARQPGEKRLERALRIAREMKGAHSLPWDGWRHSESPQPNGVESRSADKTRTTPPPPPTHRALEWRNGLMPEIPGFTSLVEIGRGAHGRVYRAREAASGRDCAIKVVMSGQRGVPTSTPEGRSDASLIHEHLVRVFSRGDYGSGWYEVMELLRGPDARTLLHNFARVNLSAMDSTALLQSLNLKEGSLHHAVREALSGGGSLHARLAASWMAGVAEAVEYLHERALWLHDIKPANLLLASDGRLVLTDFQARGGDKSNWRQGTPRYLAPERVASWAGCFELSADLARASDIWALGAVLYEMLALEPAVQGSTMEQVLVQSATRDIAPLASVARAVPEAIEQICMAALSRDPAARPASARQLAADLRATVTEGRRTATRIRGRG